LIFVSVLTLLILTPTRYRVVVLTSLRLMSLLPTPILHGSTDLIHDKSELET